MRAYRLDYIILLASLLVLWQGFFFVAGVETITPPLETLRRVGVLLSSERFWHHAAATGLAFFYACLVALLGGLTIGVALGNNRLAGDVGDSILSSLYSVPKITLYPVILLVFGLGISAKIAFGALHGIFPVALFSMGAIRNISPVVLRTARIMRLTPFETARTVLLPAALPEIVTGLRIGFSTTLLGTLIGEFFASDRGIGFILIRATESHNVLDTMALTVLLFGFAAIANSALLIVEHHVHKRA